MTHHLTNWMGDDGFLLHSETKIRHHNPEGDTLFINGEVTAVDGDLVTVAHEARNQDGALSIIGTGRVRLPSQAAK